VVVVLLAPILLALLFTGALRFLIVTSMALGVVVSAAGYGYAAAQQIPQWDVDGICRKQIGPSADGLQNRINLNECIDNEQSSYEFLKTTWSVATEEIQSRCVALQNNSPIKKYAQLATCVAALSSTNGDNTIPPSRFHR
jgi:hypothetical protein